MQLSIVKSEQFGNVQCDFWRNENGEVFMTTEQLGSALGYSQPKAAISKLIERNEYLADTEFSGVTKLTTPQGGTQETRIFTEDGIYEVTTVPPGLSELINRGGAWSNKDTPKLNNYKREVKRINGGLVTELIFIGG